MCTTVHSVRFGSSVCWAFFVVIVYFQCHFQVKWNSGAVSGCVIGRICLRKPRNKKMKSPLDPYVVWMLKTVSSHSEINNQWCIKVFYSSSEHYRIKAIVITNTYSQQSSWREQKSQIPIYYLYHFKCVYSVVHTHCAWVHRELFFNRDEIIHAKYFWSFFSILNMKRTVQMVALMHMKNLLYFTLAVCVDLIESHATMCQRFRMQTHMANNSDEQFMLYLKHVTWVCTKLWRNWASLEDFPSTFSCFVKSSKAIMGMMNLN